ncbi:MAG: hypothetical protein ACRCSQ_03335 [Bacteroidales bacterium]
MWETLLITGLIVGIAVVLLAIKILLVRGGRFPQTHISGNKALRKQGIGCAKSMDREARKRKSLFDMIDEK